MIGESYGVPVQAALADEEPEGKADLRPFARSRAFYMYSTTILRQYEGRGLGAILKAYVLVVPSRPGISGSSVTRRKAQALDSICDSARSSDGGMRTGPAPAIRTGSTC
ncbi:MAG: hypothetical protein DMD95_01365 [Candidatus Rokuibacteriota bacterium]|nr:MAG: hypothetical protein DMD95_01365 [Candidatus Rokubacteria bacterium]